MSINWRQIIFVGLGVLIGYFDRQNWNKLSMSLMMLILDYLVVETGLKIFLNKSNSISGLNLKLRWFGLLLITGLMTLFWIKDRL